jgi:hypothetical protein
MPQATDARELIEPVAWRWRYKRDGARWYHTCARTVSTEPTERFLGIDAEPIYSAAALESLLSDIERLEGEVERLKNK